MYSNVQKYKKLRTTPLSENDPTLANFPLTFRIYICRIRQLCSKYLYKNKLLVTTKTQQFLTRRKERERVENTEILFENSKDFQKIYILYFCNFPKSRRIVQTRHHIWNLIRFQHIMLMQHFGESALSTIIVIRRKNHPISKSLHHGDSKREAQMSAQ